MVLKIKDFPPPRSSALSGDADYDAVAINGAP
jgi:hypothetical protein